MHEHDDRTAVNGLRLFISHSSSDVELATALIDLVRGALNLPAVVIRCTSVDGYRLQAGADTNEQLRREVHEADAFIGIVSATSLRSLYVLFELGARWGAKKHLIPLLSPGTEPSILDGPLAALNALRTDNRAQLHQLVTDLASVLGISPESPSAYEKHITRILAIQPTPSAASVANAASSATSSLPPQITVVPYEGSEAILLVENTGGEAVFTAEAQVVDAEGSSIGHPAPYRMLWRDTVTHRVIKGHDCPIQSGQRMKLLVAEWESGGDWGKPSMNIIGDRGSVDSYRHDPWEKRSPLVTLKVSISSRPPLTTPFLRRYSVGVPAKTLSKVAITQNP